MIKNASFTIIKIVDLKSYYKTKMKTIFIILFVLITKTYLAQDSSMAKPNFNYFEANITSNTAFNIFENKLNSLNSLNIGAKINRHKLTIGIELNPLYIIGWSEAPSHYITNKIILKPNFKANYYFYLSKKNKKANSFLFLNYNTQQIKDYINEFEYEKKWANAYGLGYGITFYLKKHFLIEPSLLVNTTWFKDKDVYVYKNLYTTTYRTSIAQGYIVNACLGLKLGYIIPFKNK